MMQAVVKHREWIIKVNAKAKNFHFQIRGSRILPNWRFSLLLKLQNLILKIESNSEPESWLRRRKNLIRSKCLGFLDACGVKKVKKLALLKKRPETGFPWRRQGWFISQVGDSRFSQYKTWNKLNGLLYVLAPFFFLYMVRSSDDLVDFLILLNEALGINAERS